MNVSGRLNENLRIKGAGRQNDAFTFLPGKGASAVRAKSPVFARPFKME